MYPGIEIESDIRGDGREVAPGDTVNVAYRLSLSHGEVVQLVQRYIFVVGHPKVIAALSYGVEGMRVGGRRRFRVGPDLAYGEAGVEDVVPPNAELVFDLELLAVSPAS